MSKEKKNSNSTPEPQAENNKIHEEVQTGAAADDQVGDNTNEQEKSPINTTDSSDEEQLDPEYSSADEKTGKLEKEILDYRDKLIRKVAEFENYKKRTADEYVRLLDTAGEKIIAKILPVFDDLERMQKSIKPATSVEDLSKGMDLIINKFQSILNSYGVKEIPAIKEEFNPDLHEALMQMENPDFQPNQIIDQHEKGYTLNGKVIRHSKVLVAK